LKVIGSSQCVRHSSDRIDRLGELALPGVPSAGRSVDGCRPGPVGQPCEAIDGYQFGRIQAADSIPEAGDIEIPPSHAGIVYARQEEPVRRGESLSYITIRPPAAITSVFGDEVTVARLPIVAESR
jgi:hypothetical protein